MSTSVLSALSADRVIAVIRAQEIPDAAALCGALVEGGIHWVEFTFTTPGVAALLQHAGHETGRRIGAGTVLTRAQAEEAIAAGAQFLVTPGCRPAVAAVANEAGIPVIMGALTPTEVAVAVDLGATAVKVFPAHTLGPRYFADLAAPYPGVPLVASGGVNSGNAADYLAAGAVAVCAGSEVVPAALVAGADWAGISARGKAFVDALGSLARP